jgi:hypothetical protein
VTNGFPAFAQQRLVFVALLLGIVLYAVVVGFVLRSGRLVAEPLPILDQVTPFAGFAIAIAAIVLRAVLSSRAESAPPERRSEKRFVARLASIAVLEAGCLLGITTWMVNGTAIPNLLVAGVLFAIAVVFVPFSDPDAGVA